MIEFAFRKSNGSAYERMVTAFTGQFVHVDLVVYGKAYTAYVNETFSENEVDRNNSLMSFMELPVTIEEEQAIYDWVKTHVEKKTPYNYNDLCLCVVPLPFMKDADANDAKTLFCSQACVLALRSALTENQDLVNALSNVNSRLCTPQAFYKVISPFCAIKEHENNPYVE